MFRSFPQPPLPFPAHWIGARSRWREEGLQPVDALVSLPPAALTTHALLLGATGSGKTTLIHHLIAQDILLGHSFVVIDMRGDLVRTALELCAGRVDPSLIQVLDLREKHVCTGFNPLYGNGEAYFRALAVLDVVASESESWGVQLAETLRNSLLLLAEAGQPITELEKLLYDRGFLYQCLRSVQSEGLAEFWHRFDALAPNNRSAFAVPVLNKVSLLLATKTLRSILGHPHPFDVGQHLNTPGSITLVSLAADELHGAGRMFGSLMIAAISREIFARTPIPEAQRNPVRLYVDEFEHFGTHLFEPILAEGRKFKLGAVLAHQTLAQLSPKMRSLILGNVGVKVVFRCGREDSSTLSRDLFGNLRDYDFADLSVGTAVLWQKNKGCLELEVNQPLLTGSGDLSPHARALLAALYSKDAGTTTPLQQSTSLSVEANTSPLEDWLCD